MTRSRARALRARLALLDTESADCVARYTERQGLSAMLRCIAQTREATLRELHEGQQIS